MIFNEALTGEYTVMYSTGLHVDDCNISCLFNSFFPISSYLPSTWAVFHWNLRARYWKGNRTQRETWMSVTSLGARCILILCAPRRVSLSAPMTNWALSFLRDLSLLFIFANALSGASFCHARVWRLDHVKLGVLCASSNAPFSEQVLRSQVGWYFSETSIVAFVCFLAVWEFCTEQRYQKF